MLNIYWTPLAATPDQTTVALSCRHWAVSVWRRTRRRWRRYSFQAERQLRERQVVRCSDPACRQQTEDDVFHDISWRFLHIEQTRADQALIPAGHRTVAQCNQTNLPAYTTCLRLLRNSDTQLRALPSIPNRRLSTSMRIEWSTVSKAADR